MKDQQTARIVITGDFRQSEFAAIFEPEHDRFDFVEWNSLLKSGTTCEADLMVIAQSRRGQFAQDEIGQLLRRYPLTAKLIVFGSWCEGETRSGSPLQGVRRVYRRDWPSVVDRFVNEFQENGSTWMHSPVTVSRGDELMSTMDATETVGELAPLNIVVSSDNRDFRATIDDFCMARDWKSFSIDSTRQCDVAVVECCYSIDEAIVFGRQLTEKFGAVPLVVICGFPRQQDLEALQIIGGSVELLGKPFDNMALESAIRRFGKNGRFNVISDVA